MMKRSLTTIKICSPQLGVSPNSSLGGEIYDYLTLKGFTQKNFKVLVLLPKGREYDKSLKNFKVSYALVKHVVPPWLFSFLMLPYLFKTYRKEKFNILRIHSPGFLGIGAIIFHSVYKGVPILTSAVTVDSPKFVFPIEKWVYDNSKAIIVQSHYMKNLLIKKYNVKNAEKIHVTYGGQVEGPKKWRKKPIEAGMIKDTDKILLFMGALIKRKNPIFALEVFKKIKRRLPATKIIFIGQGPQKKNLVEKSKYKDDVIFIDKAYGEDKAYWFSRMDLFLFPSYDEGFGLVVTEAMSFGKVVITSDKAAFPEIIKNGDDGYCLALKKDLWVKTAIKVLRSKRLQTKIGKEAKIKVQKKFSLERSFKLNAKVVQNIL